ncbi:MAG: phage tail tape measure protein, partial [Actinomycetota bacterium]|nr:phage tail tape measure protein [Actinomycetota bacterium]
MATTNIGSFLVKLLFDGKDFERGAATAEQRLQAFGGSVNKAGKMLDGAIVTGLKAATAAMAAFGAISVKVGADFEQAVTTVGAVSGATQPELDALAARARELGASTAFSATQAAEGMIELARAGLSAEETIDSTGAALHLA